MTVSTDSCSKQDALVTAVNSQKTTRAHDANLNMSIVSNSPIRQVPSHPGLIYTLIVIPTVDTFQSVPLSPLQFPFSPLRPNPCISSTCMQELLFTSPSAGHLRTFEVQIELAFDFGLYSSVVINSPIRQD